MKETKDMVSRGSLGKGKSLGRKKLSRRARKALRKLSRSRFFKKLKLSRFGIFLRKKRIRLILKLSHYKLLNILEDPIFYISGNDILPPPLSDEEEKELMAKFNEKSEAVRKTLIERNLRLVVYIAKKFENTGVCMDDLVSIGSIGLIKAINTFNLEKNIKLATYASRCIENEILMHLRRNNKTKAEVSIDEPLNTDWDGNELLLSDILGTDNDIVSREIEDDVDKQLLNAAISKLNNRERQIMELRFGLTGRSEKTQKEVADMLGISQSYISRLEKRIILRLRKEISRYV